MGRVRGSGKYIYLDGDSKHPHEWRHCDQCGERYLGRLKSRFCSLHCSGKATGQQPRPAASREGYLVCTKCGEEKPEDQFDLHARCRGGRRPHCKRCRAQEFQRRNESPEFKAKQRETNRRWQAENRERANEKSRRWREANRERVRELARARYAANPGARLHSEHRRRAQKLATQIGEFTKEILTAKWAYWAGRCWMCGGEAVEWEHVKPLSKGGAHILANLRPACVACNRRKRDRWPYRP